MKKPTAPQFALCLDNVGYEAALQIGKVYRVIPDTDAEQHGYLRIIDESGEDYAFTASRFHRVRLPRAVGETLGASVSATT